MHFIRDVVRGNRSVSLMMDFLTSPGGLFAILAGVLVTVFAYFAIATAKSPHDDNDKDDQDNAVTKPKGKYK